MNVHDSRPPLAGLIEEKDSLWDIRIAVLGGGTGGPRVIRGLTGYPVEVDSITTMFDSGGSSGDLRDKFGILAPSDFTRAILAHVDSGDPILEEVLMTRFPDDDYYGMFKNHPVGNLIVLALESRNDRADVIRKYVHFLRSFRGLKGTPHPVSLENAHIITVLADGSEHVGEAYLDERNADDLPIDHIYLDRPVIAYAGAVEAVLKADLTVASMGSFYGSTLATVLPGGMPEAVAMSGGLAFPLPLMTVASETHGYRPKDYVERLLRHVPGVKRLAAVLVNEGPIPPAVEANYAAEGSHPLFIAKEEREELEEKYCDRVICNNYVDENWMRAHHGELRHNSRVLAEDLVRVAQEINQARRQTRPSTDVFRSLLQELDRRDVM